MTSTAISGQEGTPASAPVGGLSEAEKQEFVDLMMEFLGLTEAEARNMLNNVSVQQVQTYLGLANGSQTITREQAIQMWGLTTEEADALFGDSNQLGVFNNPFGDAFLHLLILSYAFELDMKQFMRDVMGVELQTAIKAAKERKEGATAQFLMAMTAALVTVGFALKNAHSASRNEKGQGNQWIGPIGASLFTAPVNAIGEYMNQLNQYWASIYDAHNQEGDKIYSQFNTLLETYTQIEEGARAGLGR